MKALDLFCGAGGASTGLAQAGFIVTGIETDADAAATHEAAGHATVVGDIAALDPLAFDAPDLLWASPPCQAWSRAGKRQGILDQPRVFDLLPKVMVGEPIPTEGWHDERSRLVLEPARWALALRPRLIACEQVPDVLPFWQALARQLRHLGYSAWTGLLDSERYGIIATCPLHDQRSVPAVQKPLDLTSLASAEDAEMEAWAGCLESAENVARRSNYVESLGSVSRATTGTGIDVTGTALVSNAWNVASLARAALDVANDATWRSHVANLLQRALPEAQIQRGRVGVAWMNAATSGSASAGSTAGSITWSSSAFLGELCAAAKSYITSMSNPGTTTQAISGYSRTTDTTRTTTTAERSRDACSLCDDMAVPQTRTRAYLIARADGQVAQPPAPTHTAYDPRLPDGGRYEGLGGDLFGDGLEPWVSMADALGWGIDDRPSWTVSGGGTETGGAEVFANAQSRSRLADVVLRGNQVPGGREPGDYIERGVSDPAITVTGNARCYRWQFAGAGATSQDTAGQVPRDLGEPAHTIAGKGTAAWVSERPATTVVGSFRPDIIAAPGYRTDVPRQDAEGSVRVTVEQAAVLQGFPADYPWQGSKTSQFRQVGNAVPPPVASAVGAVLAASKQAAA